MIKHITITCAFRLLIITAASNWNVHIPELDANLSLQTFHMPQIVLITSYAVLSIIIALPFPQIEFEMFPKSFLLRAMTKVWIRIKTITTKFIAAPKTDDVIPVNFNLDYQRFYLTLHDNLESETPPPSTRERFDGNFFDNLINKRHQIPKQYRTESELDV